MRTLPAMGAKHDHRGTSKGQNRKRKQDIDRSTTDRLINNFLARKPLLAQRVCMKSSSSNSPAGTEFMSSGGR